MRTSKTAVGLGRGRRWRRENQASTCKKSRILANIDLELSKKFVTSSCQELQDLFLLIYENSAIDDNEFLVLYEEFMSKTRDLSCK